MFIDENLEVEDQAIEHQDDMDNQQNQRNPSVSQPLAVIMIFYLAAPTGNKNVI